MGPKDVGPKAGWLRPGAHKTATPSLIAAPTFICMSRLQFAGASVIKNAARGRDPSSSLINGCCLLSLVLLSSGHVLGFIQLS